MAGVTLKKVSKRFGKTEVIRNVDLEIKDREFLVVVGPSGCGKSTLLRMVAGLEDASEGDIAIGDRRVNDVPPKDRDIAMVFQNYALYPHMTVHQNMGFGLKMRRYSKEDIDKHVKEAAQILEIEHLLERRPAQLSGGQRQRVAMGRAIVRKPKVFLFDEPLSNLDAKLRTQMRLEIKKLHQKIKTTILYVTHDQVEAMTLAERIAVIHEGVIQQIAPPIEIYNNPVNQFVAGFIGSPTMNFVEGTLEAAGEGLRVKGESFTLPLLADHSQKLAGSKGAKVVAGVRPEHLQVVDSASGKGAMKATCEVLEPLGSEVILFARINGDLLSLKIDANTNIQPGDEVALTAKEDEVKIFDAQTGINLLM